MYVRERMVVTIVLWIIIAVLLANATVMSSGAEVPLALIMMIGGALTTRFVWNGTLGLSAEDRRAAYREETVTESEKAKRTNRVSRLLDTLSDDELDELRARLMAQEDGEINTTLEELLAEREERRRRE
jgi:hypothetical protein